MGIFSDKDINDAAKLPAENKADFLKSFESGYKRVRGSRGKEILLFVGEFIPDLHLVRYDDIKRFGYGFGLLVAMLKYRPAVVISNPNVTEEFIKAVNSLKDKPSYYNHIKKLVIRWKKKVEERFDTLTKKQKQLYSEFLGSV